MSGQRAISQKTVKINVVVAASGLLPGAKHSRTFELPTLIESDDTPLNFTISASSGWSTIEPIRLGPEAALWENLYDKILQSQKYPEITVSIGDLSVANRSISANASVSLRGTTQQFPLKASLSGDKDFNGSVGLKLSQFGIPKFKALGGMIWVKDDIHVNFSGELSD